MKKLWKELRYYLLKILVPTIGFVYFYVVGKTSKTVVLAKERHDALRARYPHFIYIGWHEQVLTGAWTFRRRNIAILISQSRDGEYLSSIGRLLGYRPVRGSSSRGGVRGLLKLVHKLRSGNDVAVGADGPRGPARECKAGAIILAKRSRMPIIPVAVIATRFKRAKSWDRTIVPFPFSTLIVGYGEPIFIPEDADKDLIIDYQIQVKRAIDTLTEEIERKAAYIKRNK